MLTLKIMVACSCLAIILADILPIVKEIKYRMKRESLKPFDCNFCLSFWFGLIACAVWFNEITWINICIILFVTPFITGIIYYLWTRIKR